MIHIDYEKHPHRNQRNTGHQVCPSKLHKYFFFYRYGDHRDLHSFPTRRSSDLGSQSGPPCIASGTRPSTVAPTVIRSEEHTSELQSRGHLVCRLLLEKKKVREGINRKCIVPQQGGAHAKAPDKQRPSTDQPDYH